MRPAQCTFISYILIYLFVYVRRFLPLGTPILEGCGLASLSISFCILKRNVPFATHDPSHTNLDETLKYLVLESANLLC